MTVYCTAPWNGITVRENGDVKTCCVGNDVLGNLNTQGIQEILKSPKIIDIQNGMLANDAELHNCQHCKASDQQTGVSLRQYYNKHYPTVGGPLKLKNLDVRWSNLCNLGCVYCNGQFSSTWEDRFNIKPSRSVKPYQDDLAEFIISQANDVQEIMLVGGEPLLMKQNYELFKHLPPTTRISIITNIAYDIEQLPCIEYLLNRPKENTIWSLSLENTGAKYEYIRNGATWDRTEKNIAFLNKHWENNISILSVYGMFSAFEYSSTVSKFQSIGINKFTLQTYFGDPSFDVFKMPSEIRGVALQEMQKAVSAFKSRIHPEDVDLYNIENSSAIIAQLKINGLTDTVSKTQFYKHIEWCNQWNSNRFQDLWPDVIQLVDTYIV